MSKKVRKILLILFVFGLFLGIEVAQINNKSLPPQTSSAPGLVSEETIPNKDKVKVLRVIDGDTIEVSLGPSASSGQAVWKIRYIGIDTPEIVDPDKPVQCFGREASFKNKELVLGKEVELEKDISETDKYGRLLRYVFVDNLFINDELVRQGFAQVSTFPPDVTYQDQFLAAQKEAREENRGLWGICGKRTRSSTIVLLGDSMVHTMGEAKMLKNFLEAEYYDLTVKIVNFGVGATTVEDGLNRVQKIIDSKPDIVVIESFAYNHLAKDDGGLSRHRELLGEIVLRLKASGITKIAVLTTISPLELYAKDASESAGWSDEFRREEANWIKRYLENAISFANSSTLSLVDAYHPSRQANGYGNAQYINAADDIHPNVTGHNFVEKLISEKITALGWLTK